ncbi:unnamed protein product [Oppiella nova]|uniref:non-specific serine/threonine protein kinase n=1 Tax=Oppiella nova TaxID=334625 RepID=A0A7R9M9F7_9ACAR|nr:unnamed protein product [Oppiella nova]CAG2171930.1 unnamed protein product [Oppiella nova]
MELCSHSLQKILQYKPQVFGRQPGEPMNSIEFYISCHIFKEILECVQYLHDLKPPVIHRDLKPDNILVGKTLRNGRYLKVADFGLASLHSSSSGSHTTGVGTIQYMAPETRCVFPFIALDPSVHNGKEIELDEGKQKRGMEKRLWVRTMFDIK